MPETLFNRVAVIGLGLIGGSLAAGLRKHGLAQAIVAYDPNAVSLAHALDHELIDDSAISARHAAEGADLIIIATPVMAVGPLLEDLRGEMLRDDVIVTDVCSVKSQVVKFAHAACGKMPPGFVPGHPIAGSEQHGVTAANPDLFNHHRIILTPTSETRGSATAAVREMWQALGADVVEMDPEHHDIILAQTSHLPHLLAFALVDTLSSGGDSMEVFEYAAGGFRDFSRIAASDPIMWRDVFRSNKDPVLEVLDRFRDRLDEMREMIREEKSQELSNIFARSKAARDHFSQLIEAREKKWK